MPSARTLQGLAIYVDLIRTDREDRLDSERKLTNTHQCGENAPEPPAIHGNYVLIIRRNNALRDISSVIFRRIAKQLLGLFLYSRGPSEQNTFMRKTHHEITGLRFQPFKGDTDGFRTNYFNPYFAASALYQ